MTEPDFWKLIDETRTEDPYEHEEKLKERLSPMETEEVLRFGRIFHERVKEAYTWNLWGAAYLINGGCSDDGFEYFRRWLILQGQDVYQKALRDPDSLADLEVEMDTAEAEVDPAFAVHRQRTGDYSYYDQMDQLLGPGSPKPDLGEGWDFDDDGEMRRRYPRLFAMYLGDDDED